MFDVLVSNLDQYLGLQSAEVGVAFACPQMDFYYGFQDDVSMHAASTMKLPVMIETFRQAEQGMLSLDDYLLIKNSFRSLVDGSTYSLDAGEDSEGELYKKIGGKENIRNLVTGMITSSGNLATNILIEKIGINNIRLMIERSGANGLHVLRGVEDIRAFEAGLNNTTTASALTMLLCALANNRLPGISQNQPIIDILCRQKFSHGLPAGLPPNVRVAHKTGWITGHDHDAGIIFLSESKWYVLSVLTRGFAARTDAHNCIARISAMIYQTLAGYNNKK